MRADTGLFMAYEYGIAIGMPASEVLKLPIAEYTTGYLAFCNIKKELLEEHVTHNP